MRYVEFCGGIGGFSLGLEREGFKCVGYYEKDKYAVQTYNKNFRTNYKPTDIRKLRSKDVPEAEIYAAGFPCQSFSIAGKRMGFEDTRGTIFFEIARIVKRKKPQILFLENVKGLLNHDNGRTFTTILATLDELGYNAEWQVLNSKHFGVPQNRERVFIIGHLRGTSCRQIFPIRKSNSKNKKEYTKKTMTYQWDTSGKGYNSQQDRAYDIKGVMCTLPNANPDNKLNIICHSLYPRSGNPNQGGVGQLSKNDGTTYCIDTGNNQAISPTLTTELSHHTGRDFQKNLPLIGLIRRLTPIECERLQGFPDGWTKGVSDTQRYKQLGNAVTVNVIQHIAKKIMEGFSSIASPTL